MQGSPQVLVTGWLLVGGALRWALFGALLIALLYQLPAAHPVDVGRRDRAYVQGFHEVEPVASVDLAGSSGAARWSRASSALRFPQAGQPGLVDLRLRGPTMPVELVVLLNGTTELARTQVGASWINLSLPISGGGFKASDFFLELRAPTTELPDGRLVGVLLDTATYTVGPGPTWPDPLQLLYGALVGGLLWLLLGLHRQVALALAGYGLAWLLLYRLQPPLYPFPLLGLPLWVVGGLGGLLLLRRGPALALRWPWLISVVAPIMVVAIWSAATLLAARGHLTLARPGVENDFRVFATRETLAQVFSADGFYNLGYPLLLWLVRPFFAGNAFLAGRLVAVLAGATMLGAGYWLARSLLPPAAALLALLSLALSTLVAQYGLYLGSDMPFAACVSLSVAALLGAWQRRQPASGEFTRAGLLLIGLAGLCGGAAFLVRHLGLILLPWGLLSLGLAGRGRARLVGMAVYSLTFLLAMAPQVGVNITQAGTPLYNQQAKNIWLAVYGGTDWGRWDEAPNTISLTEVVLQDPRRFFENWQRNVVGYLGSGAEDTSEFGRALQLRLLGFPANWLASGALLAWLVALGRSLAHRWRRSPMPDRLEQCQASLLLLIALYVAMVSTAFSLPRFFLPLAPLYAAAAGWTLWRLLGGGQRLLGAGMVLIVVLWGGFATGTGAVLANQPADELAAIRMVQTGTPPEARLAAYVSPRLPLAKYSVLAHRVVAWPAGGGTNLPGPADLQAARAAGATYLLWDEAGGTPPLADPQTARIDITGRYGLYRLE